jgi:hypothetical protein
MASDITIIDLGLGGALRISTDVVFTNFQWGLSTWTKSRHLGQMIAEFYSRVTATRTLRIQGIAEYERRRIHHARSFSVASLFAVRHHPGGVP